MKLKFFHYPKDQLRNNVADAQLVAIQSGSLLSCAVLALLINLV